MVLMLNTSHRCFCFDNAIVFEGESFISKGGDCEQVFEDDKLVLLDLAPFSTHCFAPPQVKMLKLQSHTPLSRNSAMLSLL